MPARRARGVAVVACVLVLLSWPQVAGAGIPPGRLGIGDSVMLGAKQALRARGFRVVDAVVSRQFYTLAGRILHWKRLGRLPLNVVIHLGNNGTVDLHDCYRAVRAAGSGRNVFLVNLK